MGLESVGLGGTVDQSSLLCWEPAHPILLAGGARLLALCPDKRGQPVLAVLASIKAIPMATWICFRAHLSTRVA